MERSEWAHLCRVIEEVGFWDAEDKCQVDDWPTTSFRVTTGTRQKTLQVREIDWPFELWLLNAAVNEVAYRGHRWKAEAAGLRGRLQNPLPASKWANSYVLVERLESPDAILAVDGRLQFYAPLDAEGTFSIPLRAGHYTVHPCCGAPSEDIRVQPSSWREVFLNNP